MNKKIISMFTAILLAAALFTGCTAQGGKSGMAYAAQDFAGNSSPDVFALAVNAAGELVAASQADGAPVVLTTYDTAGNKKSEITTDVTGPASHFALDAKDTAYLLAGSNVNVLDADGKTANTIPAGDILSQQQSYLFDNFTDSQDAAGEVPDDTPEGGASEDPKTSDPVFANWSVNGFAAASDGSIYISSLGAGVLQIDSAGKLIRTYGAGGLNLICMNENEQLMVYAMRQSSPAVTTYDTQSGGETAKLDVSLADPSMLFYDRQQKRLLYMNADGIYPVGGDGAAGEALITLNDFSLSSATHFIAGFAMDGAQTVFIASAESGNGMGGTGGMVIKGHSASVSMDSSGNKAGRIDRLALVDASTIPEKKVLTIAGISASDNLNAAIDAFQKAHPDYRVELKTYSNEITGIKQSGNSTDLTSLIQQFNTDVIAGNNADIYILDNLPYYKYIGKGLLADLGPMMEADGLDPAQYYGNIMDACRVNGALYSIPTAFSFGMLGGKEENMPAGDAPATDDFFNAAESLPAGLAALPKGDAAQMFTEFMQGNYSFFVDQAAKTSGFGTKEFINLLKRFKALVEALTNNSAADDLTPYEQVGDGTLAFTNFEFSGLQDLTMAYALAGYDIKLQNMPSVEQGAHNFTPKGLYGINASSKNREIAWEFIKSLLSEPLQSDPMQMNGFPVNRAAMQAMVEEQIEMDESGDMRMVISTSTKQVEVKPLTREQYEAFTANFEKLNRALTPDQNIVNILNEELPSFFSGQKSAEDVAALIQNRVETILNE